MTKELVERQVGICVFILAIAVAGMVAGCGPRGEQKPTSIRFAFPNRVGIAIPIVAEEKGLFAKHNVPVRAIPLSSGAACAEALFTGAADVASLGDDLTIRAMSRNGRLRAVSTVMWSRDRYRLMIRADLPAAGIRDLIGKRVGVKKGTAIHGAFLKYADAHGLREDQFEIVDIGLGLMPEALVAGSIDAFAGSEPAPSLAEERGARALASFAELGNLYPAMLVVHESVFAGREDDREKFMAALREAQDIIEKDPETAVAAIVKRTGLAEAVARNAMQRHVYQLRMDSEILDSLRDTAEFLHKQGKIEAVPAFATF